MAASAVGLSGLGLGGFDYLGRFSTGEEYIYTCMHVYIYIYMYVYIYMHAYIYIYVAICIYTNVHTPAIIRVVCLSIYLFSLYIYACNRGYIYIYMCIYIHTSMYVYRTCKLQGMPHTEISCLLLYAETTLDYTFVCNIT